jgi:Family of unknown function (DUF6113)
VSPDPSPDDQSVAGEHVLPEVPPPDPAPRPLVRAASVVACLGGGVGFGVVAAFVQADRLVVGSLVLPWGLVLVLGTLLLAVRGSAWWVRSRAGGWAFFVGWLAATVALATEWPSGDLAISGGGRQMAYLFGGVVLGAAAATVPLIERPDEPGARVPT